MTVDPTAAPAVRLAQRIRELRERAGLTRAQLADRARMHQESTWRLEHATTTLPSLTTVVRLAEALGVEPSELLCVLDSRWAMTEQWRREREAAGQRVSAGDVDRYDPMELTRVLAERQAEEAAP